MILQRSSEKNGLSENSKIKKSFSTSNTRHDARRAPFQGPVRVTNKTILVNRGSKGHGSSRWSNPVDG